MIGVLFIVVILIGLGIVLLNAASTANQRPTTGQSSSAVSSSSQSTPIATTSSQSLPITTTTSSNTTTKSDDNCPSSYSGLDSVIPSSNQEFPILSISDNETAILCVTYINSTNASFTANLTGLSGVEIGSFASGGFKQSTFFTVTSNTSVVTVESGTSQTVAYQIHPDNGSKGFYYLRVGYLGPTVCDTGLPLAAGYTFTQDNKSGSYFDEDNAGSCILTTTSGSFSSSIQGFIGMQETFVGCGDFICDQYS